MSSEIDIGQLVKEISRKKGVGPTELGKRIGTSKQNIYGIFQRKSMDSALLYRLSVALEVNLFQPLCQALEEELGPQLEGGVLNGNGESGEALPIHEKLEHLSNEVELLRQLNNLQKEKLRAYEQN